MMVRTVGVSALNVAGGFLVAEGVISIVGSEDQRGISQAGRMMRVFIGLWLVSM